MSDLIERQAILDALQRVDCSDGVGISIIACGIVEDIEKIVKQLPSATERNLQPEHWEYELVAKEQEAEYWHEKANYYEQVIVDLSKTAQQVDTSKKRGA